MKVIAIIPARMASTRFPGKPLAKIQNLSMIEHVYKRSALAKTLDHVYVATCDNEIKDAVEAFGGKAVMTKDTHQRASDRTAEALLKVEDELGEKFDVVAMIQGDEPMIVPEMIDESLKPFEDEGVKVVNLTAPLKTKEEQEDINEVKVVINQNNDALYFSREPIPFSRDGSRRDLFKQVSIMPFRREFLLKFNELKPTPLEVIESVDMLRFLENGIPVRMVLTGYETLSVDTPQDLQRVEELMQNDILIESYRN